MPNSSTLAQLSVRSTVIKFEVQADIAAFKAPSLATWIAGLIAEAFIEGDAPGVVVIVVLLGHSK